MMILTEGSLVGRDGEKGFWGFCVLLCACVLLLCHFDFDFDG